MEFTPNQVRLILIALGICVGVVILIALYNKWRNTRWESIRKVKIKEDSGIHWCALHDCESNKYDDGKKVVWRHLIDNKQGYCIEKPSTRAVPNALIIDREKGLKLEYIGIKAWVSKETGKKTGKEVGEATNQLRLLLFKGKLVYLFKRDYDGKLQIVNVPNKIGVLPEKLYFYLHPDEIKHWWTIPLGNMEKLAMGALVGVIGIAALFAYLLVNGGEKSG